MRELVEASSAHPDGMAALALPPAAAGPVALLQLCDVAQTAFCLAEGVKSGATRDKFLGRHARGARRRAGTHNVGGLLMR